MDKILFTVGLVLGGSSALLAQDGVQDPIDMRLEQCLQDPTGQTTVGMVQCAQMAEMAWDADMNRSYEALLKLLAPQGQAELRTAQRAWLAFRDAQFKANGEVYVTEQQGTMYQVITANADMELVKRRALELRWMLGDITPK